jgi:hypothetical protein
MGFRSRTAQVAQLLSVTRFVSDLTQFGRIEWVRE